MSDIRLLQDCIVVRAERHAVSVIESTSIEHATAALLDLVLSRAEPLVRAL
jgi:2-phosphoglycerate kinase